MHKINLRFMHKSIKTMLVFILFLVCNLSFSKEWNFDFLKSKGIDNSFLCFMDRKWITDKTSPQYSFLSLGAKPMNYGIYNYHNHYIVAVSPQYGKIGDEITVTFNNGVKIFVLIGDYKKPSETNVYGIHPIGNNKGCQLEFIVDTDKIPPLVGKLGDFSTIYPSGIRSIENKNIS